MPMTRELNYKAPVSRDFESGFAPIPVEVLLAGDWTRACELARHAIAEDGFLRIALQSEQVGAIRTLQERMAGFFAADFASKTRFRDNGNEFGWTPCFEEPAYQPDTVAGLESFDVTKDSLYGEGRPNWPDEPALRLASDEIWRSFTSLGDRVLELLARTTGLPANALRENCDSGDLNTLRLLHYPAEDRTPAEHEVGIAAHTDFECITLLYQSRTGLEVRKPDASWETAPAHSETLIVLFGDMLERWTNGEIQATGHRVGRSHQERFSIVLFIAANPGIKVAPLPHFTGPDRPSRYDALEQGAHIDNEIARAKNQQEKH